MNRRNDNKLSLSTKAHQTKRRDTGLNKLEPGILCYSSARNSDQLRGFQKSSAGIEPSPSAFVKTGAVHHRT